jgi:orotate phosphoribosyltransferase-like protein
MPKKKYNDEELKQKALELRKQGLSYREIAKMLNCSIFKVHELLSKKKIDLEKEIDVLKTDVGFIMEVELSSIKERLDKIENEIVEIKKVLNYEKGS